MSLKQYDQITSIFDSMRFTSVRDPHDSNAPEPITDNCGPAMNF